MKRGNLIRIKCFGIIFIMNWFLVVLICVSTKYLVGLKWEILLDSFFWISIIVTSGLAIAFIGTWTKLHPVFEYYEKKDKQPKCPAF
jgi:hypothetical protein